MSKGWVTLKEAHELDPEFKPGWSYNPETGSYESRFGKVESRVQLKADGSLDFDRMVYHESANINAVVWGRDEDGEIRVAITIQGRPFADDPYGGPSEPIIFGQPCVMGFNLARVAGEDAAIREASEEAGTQSAVIDVRFLGHHNPNPTFCATWSDLLSIQVDLTKVTDQVDRKELIYRAEYVPIKELLRRISVSQYEGVNYRSATANDAFFVWLAMNLWVLEEII
jgi:8-oxo-dGTP pyrophosphatase MutT (NUDIX family)